MSDTLMPEGEEAAPAGTHAMAIVRWAMVGFMALAAAGSIASHLGAFAAHGEEAGASSEKQYYCPMHPGVVQARLFSRSQARVAKIVCQKLHGCV